MGIGRDVERSVARGLAEAPARDPAVVTWRYLRLALVLLVLGLGAAIGYERAQVGTCWQESISAYYYTPAQNVLVGALVAIGVCLVCLRGASDGEETLLDLAGLCAPFVALVPIPATGSCGSVLTGTADRAANVGNNVTALLVMAWLVLAALAVLAWRSPTGPTTRGRRRYAIGLAAVVAVTAVFVVDRDLVADSAHAVAAVLLFAFVFANVCLNSVQRRVAWLEWGAPGGRFNRYAVVAAAMLVDAAVHVVLWLQGWPYWILTLEASLIALFAVFWAVQTAERWEDGITPRPRSRIGSATDRG
jgi:hypothetical protein